jgi:hypothetical protein
MDTHIAPYAALGVLPRIEGVYDALVSGFPPLLLGPLQRDQQSHMTSILSWTYSDAAKGTLETAAGSQFLGSKQLYNDVRTK